MSDAKQPRKNLRKHVAFPVKVSESSPKAAHACVAYSFGAGGLGFEGGISLWVGATVRLEFTLPGEQRKMVVDANVRSCDPVKKESLAEPRFRIGVQFVGLSPAEEMHFGNYMSGSTVLF